MNLGTIAGREKCVKGKQYAINLDNGLHIVYRRGQKAGIWWGRLKRPGEGAKYWWHKIGKADDFGTFKGMGYTEALTACTRWGKEQSGGVVQEKHYGVDDCMRDYLAHLARERKVSLDHPRMARVSATVAAFILPQLGPRECARLQHGMVRDWRDKLATAPPRVRSKLGQGVKHREFNPKDSEAVRKRQASVNRVLSVLKAALNLAKAEKRIPTDEAWRDVKPFRRVNAAKVRFLTLPEATALVGACEADFADLVRGALLTGARCGELTQMLLNEFSESQEWVYVRESKNGEPRHVSLNPAGVAFFRGLCAGRKPSERIFVKANGKPWGASEQKRPMDTACAMAKVEGVTFHILRHSYASHSLMAAMTIEVLAQQLGHKDTRVTLRHYAHLCKTFKQDSVKRFAPSFGFDVA
jgi:integrase